MRRPLCSLFTAAAAALVALAPAAPTWAERLERLGTAPDAYHDEISVDLASITMAGPYRVASIVNVYSAPRTNSAGFTTDRHINRVAFDCAAQTYSPIVLVGYLNGKQVAHSPERVDWRTKFMPLQDDPLTQAVFKTVCSAPITSGSVAPRSGPVDSPPVPEAPATSAPLTSNMSAGRGVVVDEQGYLLTNAHVVDGCKAIVAKVEGLSAVPARVEAVDPKSGLALLMTRQGYGAPAVFRSQARPVKLGESVETPGYSLPGEGAKANYGEVSSAEGPGGDDTPVRFSAPVAAGDGGGPVFDSSGRVIGVVAAQDALPLSAKVGTIPQNVSFAIKGELAQAFMAAHGVRFAADRGDRKLEIRALAELGQKSTADIACLR